MNNNPYNIKVYNNIFTGNRNYICHERIINLSEFGIQLK
jgi:hypothetical protein